MNGLVAAAQEPLISGRYFLAFQEVVSNLLSNAFKYGNGGLKTQVLFSFTHGEGYFSVKCANSIPETHVTAVTAKLPATIKLAGNIDRDLARKDAGSGFQK